MEKRQELATSFRLEGKPIGLGYPVFIIAEVGVNHNGDKTLAKEMIRVAAECGVDCVKFQTFKTEEFLADEQMTYQYQVDGRTVVEKMGDMFRRLELPLSWHEELFQFCRKNNLVPMTSVADAASADVVESLGTSALKLSSDDFINLPLIEHVMRKKMPLIFSTGMADEEEIEDVLNILWQFSFQEAAFLHCVSLYPTPDAEVNLRRMVALKEKTGAVVGYSDHSIGGEAALGAVALGAAIVEKHFTLDKHMGGPDHYFSADPKDLKTIVNQVRTLEKMLGSGKIHPGASEAEARKEFRRSIVAARDLPKGHILSAWDICLKRPGNGLRARERNCIIGRRLACAVRKDRQVTGDMLKPLEKTAI